MSTHRPTHRPTQRSLRLQRRLGAALLCALLFAPMAWAQTAAALKARHVQLADGLAHNAFARPLVLDSSETAGHLKGDIYARIAQPFTRLAPALLGSEHWCEILILHLNVKRCRASMSASTSANTPVRTPASTAASSETLSLVVGQKFDQPTVDAYRIEFVYQLTENRPDYLQLVLSADAGPLGTRQYRIVVEAVALDGGQSFLHLSYAYDQGLAARLAMQAYLATLGRAKVGFSVVGLQPDGAPIYVGNLRGVIERNTMRYYLAIEAYLGALDTPPALQMSQRLNDWHSGVERYPRQLHELERNEYLALKRGQLGPPHR